MKRNKIALAMTSGIVGLSALSATMAFAGSGQNNTATLEQFLNANPAVAAVVPNVQRSVGGPITSAEFDDEAGGNSVVEFKSTLADGTVQAVFYSMSTGEITEGTAESGGMDAKSGVLDHDGDRNVDTGMSSGASNATNNLNTGGH